MKYMLLGLLLLSCSHQPFAPKSVESKRLPASVEEFQSYEYGYDKSEIRLTADTFSKADLTDYSFADFVATAQRNDYKKIIIDPSSTSPMKKVSSVDDSTSAGDFIVLIGTNFSNADQTIRKGDYDDIYSTVTRLSWLKFRTTINLVASVSDLRSALKNDRPTIIMWTSHGNKEYFYDFNQIQIPHSVFKNTSPKIYQFILTACDGFTALQNGYKKSIPPTLSVRGWARLVYHPGDVKTLLTSDDWNPYDNHPGPLINNGMVCKKTGDAYAVFSARTGAMMPNSVQNTFENCMYTLANSDKDYICAGREGKAAIYNHRLKDFMPGDDFDNNYDCVSRITNSMDGKVCRRIGDNVYYFDRNNKISSEKFNDINACFQFVQTTTDI